MCGTGHFLWHLSLIDDLVSFHFMITKIKSCIIKLRLLGHLRLTEQSVTYQGPHEPVGRIVCSGSVAGLVSQLRICTQLTLTIVELNLYNCEQQHMTILQPGRH